MATQVQVGDEVRWIEKNRFDRVKTHRGHVSEVQGDTALIKKRGERRVRVAVSKLVVLPRQIKFIS